MAVSECPVRGQGGRQAAKQQSQVSAGSLNSYDVACCPPRPGSPRSRSDGCGLVARRSDDAEAGHRVAVMLRPESWSRLTGGSPVRVGTGAPGSRPRFVVERRRAERGVKSLFGGSKRAGRSVKRTLQPRHTHSGGAEPLMSRRRPCLPGPVPGSAWRVLPGYGGRHARTVWAGTGEARLPGLRRARTAGISRW
jgi:hypothetical protein